MYCFLPHGESDLFIEKECYDKLRFCSVNSRSFRPSLVNLATPKVSFSYMYFDFNFTAKILLCSWAICTCPCKHLANGKSRSQASFDAHELLDKNLPTKKTDFKIGAGPILGVPGVRPHCPPPKHHLPIRRQPVKYFRVSLGAINPERIGGTKFPFLFNFETGTSCRQPSSSQRRRRPFLNAWHPATLREPARGRLRTRCLQCAARAGRRVWIWTPRVCSDPALGCLEP